MLGKVLVTWAVQVNFVCNRLLGKVLKLVILVRKLGFSWLLE